MLDLGTSFLASADRDPHQTAIVDGDLRLTYVQWLSKILALANALEQSGVQRGEHLVTVLQNNWQAATVHWACQFAGIIVTPVNWRATADDVAFTLENSDARGIVWQDVANPSIDGAAGARKLTRICIDDSGDNALSFDEMVATDGSATVTQAADRSRSNADDWSLMLYTSGTTARPKGVPRRHRAERAAAIAHVAQNAYLPGEITLGVMPLYHTMGVRSLLAMSLVGGTFVCLPTYSSAAALALIERERISNLYLVPTLYHDLLHHPDFSSTDVSSVTKLGFAGASMTDDLLKRLDQAFRPELFVNHYGSSEIYTFTIKVDAPSKPGCAGKAGINQMIRVVRLGADIPEDLADVGEEGEIIASLAGDESFEGYWRRPEADEKSLKQGWYFTGDSGYVDEDGELYVTGRVDDMIITGGENVSPVDIESCLSLHPGVDEVAVVGLPDEKWGKIVVAFVKRNDSVTSDELDAHCLDSDLARFKRPRRYVFVNEIPKSPVGKLLRRLLIAGEYEPER